MLRGIDRIITADLLHALRAMGHGDSIALVDANYPAFSNARRFIPVSGADASALLRAILPLFPVDDFIEDPLVTMQIVGDPETTPPAVREFQAILRDFTEIPLIQVPREEFYRRGRDSYAIVQTGDVRLYANIILTKGVIRG